MDFVFVVVLAVVLVLVVVLVRFLRNSDFEDEHENE